MEAGDLKFKVILSYMFKARPGYMCPVLDTETMSKIKQIRRHSHVLT